MTTGKNAIANAVGGLVPPLIALVMTPFYLRQIGLTGLGLIGFLSLLTTTLTIFVAGFTKTYQRDLSSTQAADPGSLPGLMGGGLLGLATLGIILGTAVLAFGRGPIAQMADGSGIDEQSLNHCLLAIGALLALGVIHGAAVSTLFALRDQIWPTLTGTVLALLTALAGYWSLSRWPLVENYYYCQVGGAFIGTAINLGRCAAIARRDSRGQAAGSVLAIWGARLGPTWKLALMLMIHEGLGVVIAQMDRILVSSRFSLIELGSYNLAANPSRFVSFFGGPVNTATFPEFCRMISMGADRNELGEYLGRVTFLMTLLFSCSLPILIPAGQVLLELWLGKDQVPTETLPCLILLCAGHLLLGIAGPSYNLTVASGRVGYGMIKNLAALVWMPALGLLLIRAWGLAGAAAIWMLYGFFCILVCGWIAFRRHAAWAAAWPWLRTSLASISLALFFTVALEYSQMTGTAIVLASVSLASCLALLMLGISCGFNYRKCLEILEAPVLNKATV